jgi:flagellar motor switch protein FliM
MGVHYPRTFLEPILDNLRSTVNDDAVAVDAEWEAEMNQALDGVPLSMRVVLGRCTMDIARFLKLSPGDLLPLSKGEHEPAVLWIGSRPMFDVMAGSQDGKLAIEIMNETRNGGAS